MEPANNNSVNPVTLPSIAEIKAAIAEHKATKGRISKYNPCKIGVADCYLNADHLLNIMQVLPGCTARKEAGSKKGIFFESDTGEAFLLPVNPNY